MSSILFTGQSWRNLGERVKHVRRQCHRINSHARNATQRYIRDRVRLVGVASQSTEHSPETFGSFPFKAYLLLAGKRAEHRLRMPSNLPVFDISQLHLGRKPHQSKHEQMPPRFRRRRQNRHSPSRKITFLLHITSLRSRLFRPTAER